MAWPPPQASLFADGRLHLHQGPIDLIVEAFGAGRDLAYRAAVAEAIENILDGDYYQANLSHQLNVSAADGVCPFDLFRRLAERSDAFHGALLQYEDGAVVSNSPERFFRVEQDVQESRRIVTEPIKGTRPRGGSRRKWV